MKTKEEYLNDILKKVQDSRYIIQDISSQFNKEGAKELEVIRGTLQGVTRALLILKQKHEK